MNPSPDKPWALVVTRNLPPLLGGMERLVWHLVDALRNDWRVHVVGPEGSGAHLPLGVSATEVPLAPLGRFLAGCQWAALRQARARRPQWVLAGSGLTVPAAWLAARASGAALAAYLHGLDITVDQPVYRHVWLPFFRRCDRVFVNSGATARLAAGAGVGEERITVVPPGVHMPEPSVEAQKTTLRTRFRHRHGLGAGPLLLSIGRLTARKGLLPFVRDVLPRIAQQIPEVHLAVIGGPPKNALAAQAQTPERILSAAGTAGVADRVHLLGAVSEDELQAAYWSADVHVFPVQEIPGDPEGFGMVAVEAAAHGLATVAYATGGVVDAVGEGISGRLVTPGDTEGFANRVCELLRQPLPAEPMQRFAQGFAWEVFGHRIVKTLSARNPQP